MRCTLPQPEILQTFRTLRFGTKRVLTTVLLAPDEPPSVALLLSALEAGSACGHREHKRLA